MRARSSRWLLLLCMVGACEPTERERLHDQLRALPDQVTTLAQRAQSATATQVKSTIHTVTTHKTIEAAQAELERGVVRVKESVTRVGNAQRSSAEGVNALKAREQANTKALDVVE